MCESYFYDTLEVISHESIIGSRFRFNDWLASFSCGSKCMDRFQARSQVITSAYSMRQMACLMILHLLHIHKYVSQGGQHDWTAWPKSEMAPRGLSLNWMQIGWDPHMHICNAFEMSANICNRTKDDSLGSRHLLNTLQGQLYRLINI